MTNFCGQKSADDTG